MKFSTLLWSGALCSAGALLVWTMTASAGWQRANADLQKELNSAPAEAAEPSAASLKEAIPDWSRSELARLRNEVRQLREQQAAANALKAQNLQLTNAIAALPPSPRLAEMPGFQDKAAWKNVGHLTPEQSVQTFFWAVREGDLEQLLRCSGDQEAKQMQSMLARDQEKGRQQFLKELQTMTNIPGYRIAEQEIRPDGSVILSLQVAAGGEILDMVLVQVGSEWKLDKMFVPHGR